MPPPRRHFGTKPATVAQRRAALTLFLTRARDPHSFSDEQLARQHQLAEAVVREIREGVGRA